MNTLYCTYYQNGMLKRAVLNQAQYERYDKDPSVTGLQLYASQQFMEAAYNQEKGIAGSNKTMLLG
jgi:hypothetical protein